MIGEVSTNPVGKGMPKSAGYRGVAMSIGGVQKPDGWGTGQGYVPRCFDNDTLGRFAGDRSGRRAGLIIPVRPTRGLSQTMQH